MDHFQSFDQNNIPINNPTLTNNVEADIVQKSTATSRRAWSQKEDNLLKQAIKIHGTNWIQVASSLQNRNPSQCAQRWKRIKPYNYNMRKPWTAKEDQLLLKLVQSHKKNWVQIAKCIPNRTSKQVRERFVNKLNPEINKDPFSTEEDLIIVEGFKSFGSKWCKISKLLKGRPENIIKNRFYSFIRKHYFNIENPYYVIPQHQPDQQLLLLRDSEVKQTKKNFKITQKERRKKIRQENQFENQDIQNNEKEENNNQQSSLQKKTKPQKSERNIMKKRKLQESKVEEKRNVEDEILENQQEILEREQVKEEKSISQDQVKEEVESENQSQNEHLKEENQQKLSQFAPFPVIYNGVQPFKIMYFYPSTMNVQLLSHYYMNTPYLQYGVQSQETLLSRSQDIQYQKKNTQ